MAQKNEDSSVGSLFRRERTKQKRTLVLMVLSYIPFLLLALLPEFNVDSVLGYIASQTGYAAAVMLVWQFILGTRSLSKLWLTDQIWAIDMHKKIGIFGILLVLIHPILLGIEYAWSFRPSFASEYEKHVTFGMIALSLYLFVWLSSAVLRSKIGYRPWKYIHFLTYPMMMAVVMHPPEIGRFFLASSLIPIYWGAISLAFFAAVLIRLGSFFTIGQQKYTLQNVEEIAEDVFRYTLTPKGKKIAPLPGQFVYMRRGIFSEEHPFSVANYDESNGTIEIAAKRFGKYTTKLASTKVGSSIYLDGPYGVFTKELLVTPNQPTVFIAGGIGITPFLRHLYSDKTKNYHVINANRSEKNIVYREQLKRILGKRYLDVLSDTKNSSSDVAQGYVTGDLIKNFVGPSFAKQHFYICGPPIMMQSVSNQLTKMGIADDQIHTEEFGY